MKKSSLSLVLLSLLLVRAHAQPPPLQDPFLDNFVGDWRVERNMGKRGVKQTTVHCEWALNHQFIEFHYGGTDPKVEYEAFVFIGFDNNAKSYVCHWVDIFGATYSALGSGKLDPPSSDSGATSPPSPNGSGAASPPSSDSGAASPPSRNASPARTSDAASDKQRSLEFRFLPKDGDLTNKFTFDPQTKTWTSLIRQTEKGEWVTFAEEKWTKK